MYNRMFLESGVPAQHPAWMNDGQTKVEERKDRLKMEFWLLSWPGSDL